MPSYCKSGSMRETPNTVNSIARDGEAGKEIGRDGGRERKVGRKGEGRRQGSTYTGLASRPVYVLLSSLTYMKARHLPSCLFTETWKVKFLALFLLSFFTTRHFCIMCLG